MISKFKKLRSRLLVTTALLATSLGTAVGQQLIGEAKSTTTSFDSWWNKNTAVWFNPSTQQWQTGNAPDSHVITNINTSFPSLGYPYRWGANAATGLLIGDWNAARPGHIFDSSFTLNLKPYLTSNNTNTRWVIIKEEFKLTSNSPKGTRDDEKWWSIKGDPLATNLDGISTESSTREHIVELGPGNQRFNLPERKISGRAYTDRSNDGHSRVLADYDYTITSIVSAIDTSIRPLGSSGSFSKTLTIGNKKEVQIQINAYSVFGISFGRKINWGDGTSTTGPSVNSHLYTIPEGVNEKEYTITTSLSHPSIKNKDIVHVTVKRFNKTPINVKSKTVLTQINIANTSLPPATVGQPYSAEMSANPAGTDTLSWNPVAEAARYRIYRTPAWPAIGGNPVEYRETTGTSYPMTITGTTSYTYRVSAVNNEGDEGSKSVAVKGGLEDKDIIWAVVAPANGSHVNEVPEGLVWKAGSTFGGIPERTGNYQLTFLTKDRAQTKLGSKSFTITVNPPLPLLMTTTDLPPIGDGQQVSFQLEATGGYGPYIWSVVSGEMPGGVWLHSDGTVTGIGGWRMIDAGPVTIKVEDASGFSATRSFSNTFDPLLQFFNENELDYHTPWAFTDLTFMVDTPWSSQDPNPFDYEIPTDSDPVGLRAGNQVGRASLRKVIASHTVTEEPTFRTGTVQCTVSVPEEHIGKMEKDLLNHGGGIFPVSRDNWPASFLTLQGKPATGVVNGGAGVRVLFDKSISVDIGADSLRFVTSNDIAWK